MTVREIISPSGFKGVATFEAVRCAALQTNGLEADKYAESKGA